MNSYFIIGLIAVLSVILVLLIRLFVPSVKRSLEQLPKWFMLLLMAAVVVAIFFLVRSLDRTGGMTGGSGAESKSTAEEHTDRDEAKLTDCIILRADEIRIGGQAVDMDYAAEYLEQKAAEGTAVTIVDDYSLAALYREITALCDDKGVKYNTQDEKWLEEQ